MKRVMIIVFAGLTIAASAQGLLNRRGLRSRASDVQPLVELMPFTNAVVSAKTGDGAGLYAVAIYLARGIGINQDGRLAYKYLCKAADAGYVNAQFVRHVVEENATSERNRCWRLPEYIGGSGVFGCTNKFCEGSIDVSDKEVVSRLLALYRADVVNGVAAATNEVARIETEIKQVEEAQERERVARENRERNLDFLTRELGEENSQPPRELGENPGRSRSWLGRPLLRERRMMRELGERPLESLIPFEQAVLKAKDANGAGYYAVALHYALGREIGEDNAKAAKYLAKAVEVKYPAAIFVDAMVSEECLDVRVAAPLTGEDVVRYTSRIDGGAHPNVSKYTGGARAFQFDARKQSLTSFTNATDVAAVRARYEMAIRLGVSAATNELKRFEARVLSVQAAAQKMIDEVNARYAMLARNAKLAKNLLNEEEPDEDRQRHELERVGSELEREEQRKQLLRFQEELRKELRKARQARELELAREV